LKVALNIIPVTRRISSKGAFSQRIKRIARSLYAFALDEISITAVEANLTQCCSATTSHCRIGTKFEFQRFLRLRLAKMVTRFALHNFPILVNIL